MTDLEICKRIAQIEQVDWMFSADYSCVLIRSRDGSNFFNEYSPLTDKALCFDLMVKYRVSLINVKNSTACYAVWDDSAPPLNKTETGTNPQRAICLAIIAKHEVDNA